jgi:hypothetical protein
MTKIQMSERDVLGRNTLRLLCSVLIKPGTRVEFCAMIEASAFLDVLQGVVFEEVKELGAVESRRLRELLPGRVTLRGFPEFDLQEFLAPSEVSEREIEKLFESAFRLVELSDTQDSKQSET